MPVSVVLGCQWGDEGKGKIVDHLAEDADWVARFQGGANAGHTVYVGGRQAVLHLLPTGILRPAVSCAIGNGVVLDPLALIEELREVEEMGISWRDRLRISAQTHLVTAVHRAWERLRQQDRAIGTTGRGIGPTYEDKVARRGLRAEDLLDASRFRDGLRAQWELCSRAAPGNEALPPFADLADTMEEARCVLAPLVCDLTDLLLSEDDAGRRILCEGSGSSPCHPTGRGWR